MEGLGSGQTQQTVNLPPRASKVRILPPPPVNSLFFVIFFVKKRLSLSTFRGIIRHLKFWNCNSGSYSSAVEHFLGKEEVTGSSPVMSSIIGNFFREAKNGKRKV